MPDLPDLSDRPGPGPDLDRLPPHPTLRTFYTGERERRSFLDSLFDRTAPDYDRVTWLVSLGSGAWHRRQALLRAGLRPGMTVLDVAVGTGSVAGEALRLVGPSGRVVGVDPSLGMLAQARARLRLPAVQGLAEALPFRDQSFDFLSMGYALRHVADIRTTFREYHRVLRPGGQLLILDFTRPRTRAGYRAARIYFDWIVPWAARLCAGTRDAGVLMRYLWASIDGCVPPGTISDAIAACGFEHARSKPDLGVFIEYLAVKPRR